MTEKTRTPSLEEYLAEHPEIRSVEFFWTFDYSADVEDEEQNFAIEGWGSIMDEGYSFVGTPEKALEHEDDYGMWENGYSECEGLNFDEEKGILRCHASSIPADGEMSEICPDSVEFAGTLYVIGRYMHRTEVPEKAKEWKGGFVSTEEFIAGHPEIGKVHHIVLRDYRVTCISLPCLGDISAVRTVEGRRVAGSYLAEGRDGNKFSGTPCADTLGTVEYSYPEDGSNIRSVIQMIAGDTLVCVYLIEEEEELKDIPQYPLTIFTTAEIGPFTDGKCYHEVFL